MGSTTSPLDDLVLGTELNHPNLKASLSTLSEIAEESAGPDLPSAITLDTPTNLTPFGVHGRPHLPAHLMASQPSQYPDQIADQMRLRRTMSSGYDHRSVYHPTVDVFDSLVRTVNDVTMAIGDSMAVIDCKLGTVRVSHVVLVLLFVWMVTSPSRKKKSEPPAQKSAKPPTS